MATSSITTNFVIKTKRAKKSLENALKTSDPEAVPVCDTDKLIKKGEEKLATLLSHYNT